jgi:transcriptional regulator with XRE-family HTH domain
MQSSAESPVLVESALGWVRSLLQDLAPVPQLKRLSKESFGQRLARLRSARAFTQRDLAHRSGISQRMIAYYETHAIAPPADKASKLAEALGVSLDDLLGTQRLPSQPPVVNVRLWRRFQQVEKLPPAARKAVLKVLDAYLAQHGPQGRSREA